MLSALSLSGHYDDLVNLIIRPERRRVREHQLGPSKFFFAGQEWRRHDLTLRNARGERLACCHYVPTADEKPVSSGSDYFEKNTDEGEVVEVELKQQRAKQRQRRPCVIYLHGNASCRLEAKDIWPEVFPLGFSLFAFDFAGSGGSDGDFVSLGFHEKEDLRCVLQHLSDCGEVEEVVLWGRSMGAVTALAYCQKYLQQYHLKEALSKEAEIVSTGTPTTTARSDVSRSSDSKNSKPPCSTVLKIAALVLDSPFANFRVLVSEIVTSHLQGSHFTVGGGNTKRKILIAPTGGAGAAESKDTGATTSLSSSWSSRSGSSSMRPRRASSSSSRRVAAIEIDGKLEDHFQEAASAFSDSSGSSSASSAAASSTPSSSMKITSETTSSSSTLTRLIEDWLLDWVRGSVKKKAGFDILSDLDVDSDYTERDTQQLMTVPVYFLAGLDDDFVRCSHSERLYEKWSGIDKTLDLMPGTGHNCKRPSTHLTRIRAFIARAVKQSQQRLGSCEVVSPMSGHGSGLQTSSMKAVQRSDSSSTTSRARARSRTTTTVIEQPSSSEAEVGSDVNAEPPAQGDVEDDEDTSDNMWSSSSVEADSAVEPVQPLQEVHLPRVNASAKFILQRHVTRAASTPTSPTTRRQGQHVDLLATCTQTIVPPDRSPPPRVGGLRVRSSATKPRKADTKTTYIAPPETPLLEVKPLFLEGAPRLRQVAKPCTAKEDQEDFPPATGRSTTTTSRRNKTGQVINV